MAGRDPRSHSPVVPVPYGFDHCHARFEKEDAERMEYLNQRIREECTAPTKRRGRPPNTAKRLSSDDQMKP